MVDLKELKKLIKYLRSEGITEFKQGDLEFKLSPDSPKTRKISNKIDVTSQIDIPTDEPTKDELLFWSAGGGQETPKDS